MHFQSGSAIWHLSGLSLAHVDVVEAAAVLAEASVAVELSAFAVVAVVAAVSAAVELSAVVAVVVEASDAVELSAFAVVAEAAAVELSEVSVAVDLSAAVVAVVAAVLVLLALVLLVLLLLLLVVEEAVTNLLSPHGENGKQSSHTPTTWAHAEQSYLEVNAGGLADESQQP